MRIASKDSRRLVRKVQKGGDSRHLARSERKLVSKRSGRRDVLAKRQEPPSVAEAIENVLIKGDLTDLSATERLQYYKAVCKSLGLNPLTRPFDYIAFQATENSAPRLQLYARRDCTDQLRKLYGISVTKCTRSTTNRFCTVEVEVQNKQGRLDTDIGVVDIDGLTGRKLANALMKAETKAKRRATLSICGLGIMDESEIESVEHYNMLTPAGRMIVESQPAGTLAAAQEVARKKLEEHARTGHLPPSAPDEAALVPQEAESAITESGGVKIVQGQLQKVTEAYIKKGPNAGQAFLKLLISGTEYTLFDDLPFPSEVRGCKSLFRLFLTSINEKVTLPVAEKQSGATLYRNVNAKGRVLVGPIEIEDGAPVIQRRLREPGE